MSTRAGDQAMKYDSRKSARKGTKRFETNNESKCNNLLKDKITMVSSSHVSLNRSKRRQQSDYKDNGSKNRYDAMMESHQDNSISNHVTAVRDRSITLPAKSPVTNSGRTRSAVTASYTGRTRSQSVSSSKLHRTVSDTVPQLPKRMKTRSKSQAHQIDQVRKSRAKTLQSLGSCDPTFKKRAVKKRDRQIVKVDIHVPAPHIVEIQDSDISQYPLKALERRKRDSKERQIQISKSVELKDSMKPLVTANKNNEHFGKKKSSGTECLVCGKNFSGKHGLRTHEGLCHTKGDNRVCFHCGKGFKSVKLMYQHARLHSKQERKIAGSAKGRELRDLKVPLKYFGNLKKRSTAPCIEVCNVCGRKFTSLLLLAKHIRRHTNLKTFSCRVCGCRFRRFVQLVTHHKLRHQVTGWKCNTCGKKFTTERVLRWHVSISHSHTRNTLEVETSQNKFVCVICNHGYDSKYSLNRHMKQHGEARPFQCSVCQLTFKVLWDLTKHKKCQKLKPFGCSVCHKHYLTQQSLTAHLSLRACLEPAFGMKQCETCGLELKTQAELAKHMETAHGEKSSGIVCHLCGKCVASRAVLKRHMKSVHVTDKAFSCSVCGKAFKVKDSLQRHIKYHHSGQVYECPVCNKKCSQPSNLKKHIMRHSGSKSEVCKVCGRTFLLKEQLVRHSKTHEISTQVSCNVCNRLFRNSASLQGHMKIHEAPYSIMCDVCGQCFTQRSGLYMHQKTHKEPNYSCQFCQSKFRKLLSYKVHLAKEHGEQALRELKPNSQGKTLQLFRCDLCQKIFGSRKTFQRHRKNHTGVKAFSCTQCPKTFSEQEYLKQHMKIHRSKVDFHCHICGRRLSSVKSLKGHYKSVHNQSIQEVRTSSGLWPVPVTGEIVPRSEQTETQQILSKDDFEMVVDKQATSASVPCPPVCGAPQSQKAVMLTEQGSNTHPSCFTQANYSQSTTILTPDMRLLTSCNSVADYRASQAAMEKGDNPASSGSQLSSSMVTPGMDMSDVRGLAGDQLPVSVVLVSDDGKQILVSGDKLNILPADSPGPATEFSPFSLGSETLDMTVKGTVRWQHTEPRGDGLVIISGTEAAYTDEGVTQVTDNVQY